MTVHRKSYDIDAVRARVSLSDLIGRDVEWDVKKSNPQRGDYWACCPFHHERSSSFHVVDTPGASFYKCFGCDEKGSGPFDYLMRRDGISFVEALRRLAEENGVSPDSAAPIPLSETARLRCEAEGRAAQRKQCHRATNPYDRHSAHARAWQHGFRDAEVEESRESSIAYALRIWRESDPADALLWNYLTARLGQRAVAALRGHFGDTIPTLRIHPGLGYTERRADPENPKKFKMVKLFDAPAMIGLVVSGYGADRTITGIHRTWILPDGSDRDRRADKRMLGNCYGGAVAFGPPSANMIAGEGIETTLAGFAKVLIAAQAAGLDLDEQGGYTATCPLTLGAISGAADARFADKERKIPSPVPDFNRPGWLAPPECESLIILGDGDMRDVERAKAQLTCAQRRQTARPCGKTRQVRVDWAGGTPSSGVDHADLSSRETSNV